MNKQRIIIISVILVFLLLFLLLFLNSKCYSNNSTYTNNNSKAQATEEIKQEKESLPDSIISLCTTLLSDSIAEQILVKKAYLVSYNSNTKLPNWVGWQLRYDHTDGPYKRIGRFHEDEELTPPRATLEDYKGSGWSRGHMCPAGDNKWDQQAMYETFSLSNVCPQNANLNSGLWNSIEIDCRRWANRYGEIYIVCGPLFLNQTHEVIGNNIPVPEAFFKVVLCLTGTPKGFGFIVRNTDGNKKRDLYYNSIDQVERITGYDFFSALPDEIEELVESHADIKEW